MIKSLSVFFPLFNEEGNIETTVKKAVDVLQKLKLEYEIILVNDGSTDGTKVVAEQLSKINSRIRVINHEKNLGYGEALKSGFYNAKYDYIVYTDGDGQFDFSEINKFLDKIEDYDLLIGYRIKRQDPFFRILFKKGWSFSLWTMFGLTLKDVDCGFKMIKREVLQKIPRLQSQRGAMINAELAIKAGKYGFRVGQIGVNHYPRVSGRPTGASLKVIFRSFLDLLRLWWKLHESKKLFFVFLAIIIFASFLRLYKIDQYMIFLGDQGRDALVIKRMIEEKHFPAIGPPTSVGNIYLGPLYYYMMLPPMALFGLNPVSASIMVALIGVLTVVLIYLVGKTWFGRGSGLVSAFLYAISPVNINYSRFSWNPNPTPFFALLSVFGMYKLNKSGNFMWLIFTAFALGASLQMHYLSLILIPIVGILTLHEFWYRLYKKEKIKNFKKGIILGMLAFLLTLTPLFWFDLRHNFLNFNAVVKLFGSGGAVKADIISNLSRAPEIFGYSMIGRYMAGENDYLTAVIALVFLGLLIYWFLERIRFKRVDWPGMALMIWIVVGILGLSFYQNDIYDHYLGFLNPVPFLLFGSLVSIKFLQGKIIKISLVILVIVLFWANSQKNPLNYPPNRQLQRSQEVAKFVIWKAGGMDFNFALLSENNYDSAYVFYLEIYGQKPKAVPQDKTNQLFVVCEDLICDPTHSAKYELAAFGMSKIDWMEERFGVKIYRLIPNPSGQP